MKALDEYSYQCGVIDCFNEMVRAGLKKIALSHPADSAVVRDGWLPFSREICQKYKTQFYIEDDPLITDLFPVSLNRGKYNLIFYKDTAALREYLDIKSEKKRLLEDNLYCGKARTEIAFRFGRLLSYPDEGILRLMAENQELE